MPERKHNAVRIFVAIVFTFVLSTCGGGGGGGSSNGGGGSASMNGKYFVVAQGVGDNGQPVVGWNLEKTGDVTWNGNGSATFNWIRYSTLTGSSSYSESTTWSTSGDDLSFSPPAGSTQRDGKINLSGDVVIWANIRMTSEQEIGFGVKASSSGMSDGSLTGKYWGVTFTAGNGQRNCSFDTWNFDGAGNGSISLTVNDAALGIITGSDSGGYTVGSDGSFSLGFAQGGINPSADTIVYGTAIGPGFGTGIAIKAGASTGYNNASLNGVYKVVAHGEGAGVTDSYTGLASISFNGSGSCSVTGGHEAILSVTANDPISASAGTYSVNPDGTFTFTIGGQTYDGAINQNGNKFVMTNIRNQGMQEIYFGVK